ncbi:hypothetical protein [Nonlabens xiamenensis]|uniref:hypothetical protein n=1 Tax=Nonlabens xiamenensis TaxID=2341043 RepID=UPI000F60F25B|nr:hypothetical protein [Nonlabens xiamenensis]
MEVLNPNPEMIPDSTWEEGIKSQFGEKGYMVQKYFYKRGNYIAEIEAGESKGFQAYNSEDGLLYSWQDKSDTAITLNSKKYLDELIEIIDSEETDTILGIPCRSVIVKSKMGKMTLFYNSDYLKMDSKFYEGHKYGHWEQILKKIGGLPLKMEQKGLMTHVVQTAIEFEEISIDDKKFEIPTFKEVIENPMN